ncbi:MAG: DUF3189 family protein [bacterium]|jgi:hypothetical protein
MLRIFYSCYGSAHSSILASAIHLGNLPDDRRPTCREILDLPGFDRMEGRDIGTPLFIGRDERGVEVYAIGFRSGRQIMSHAVYSLLAAYGAPRQDLLLVNSLAYVNLLTRCGGFLSRQLGIVSVGRPLAAFGIWLSYLDFVAMVREVKTKRDSLLQGKAGCSSLSGRDDERRQ